MSRTKIGPQVPDEWIEEAKESDVTRSEWFRRMVRAGRRQWGYEHDVDQPGLQHEENISNASSGQPLADLEEAILRNLSTTTGLSQEELIELLLEDLEDEMERALQSLKDDGKVDIDLNKGGWIKKK